MLPPCRQLLRPGFTGLHGRACLAVCLALCLAGCGGSQTSGEPEAKRDDTPKSPLHFSKLDLPAMGSQGTLFESLPPEVTGLHFSSPHQQNEAGLERLPALSTQALCIGDVDGDGLLDLFVTSGPGPNRLFRQIAPMRFEDITERAGVDGGASWGTGAAFADLDGDGLLDLLVCNFDAPIQCFLNEGQGRFKESAASLSLDVTSACLLPALADYDNDGDLDVYFLTNCFELPGGVPDNVLAISGDRRVIRPEYERYYKIHESPSPDGPRYHVLPAGQRDFLFRNWGDGTFENVSDRAGDLCTRTNCGNSAVWLDYDRDGDLDLYVANEGIEGTRLYHNDGGKSFRDVSAKSFPFRQWAARGSAVGDVDGDGLLDLLTLAAGPESSLPEAFEPIALKSDPPAGVESALWQATGTPYFREASAVFGLSLDRSAWQPLLGDFDLDGVMDCIASSESGLLARKGETSLVAGSAMTFTSPEDSWGLTDRDPVRSLACADLDADGDLDVISQSLDGVLHLHQNTALGGARLVLTMVSTRSPNPPVGARVQLEVDGQTLVHTVAQENGAPSSGDAFRLSLTLPTTTERFESLTIRWPSGGQHVLADEALNQQLRAAEPDEDSEPVPDRVHPLFQQSDMAAGIRHADLEPSLSPSSPPEAFYGPGMACADINSDGFDDIYLGGAGGSPGRVFLRKSYGFREALSEPFEPHQVSEDLGAVFADFDVDGHLDLYVVSGGTRAPAGHASYQDRLYRGNGRGGFVHAEGALPDLKESGGPVSAGDYDEDGDLDLFIGGRAIPGQPGQTSPSRLLENKYFPGRPPRFVLAPFSLEGRISSAVWTDIDQDGWLDLMVVDESRGARLLKNREGQLVEESFDVSFPPGQWSAIAPLDSDINGTIDYALTNLSGECGLLMNNGASRLSWKALPSRPGSVPARGAQWLDANGDGWQDLFILQNQRAFTFPRNPPVKDVGLALRRKPEGGFQPWTPYESGFIVPGVPTAMALTEINGDEAPDFLVARNNGPIIALEHRPTQTNWLSIRFHGPLRNITATGSQIAVEWRGKLRLFTELNAGSGYLAQSPNRIFFPRLHTVGEGMVKVIWPDGSKSQKEFDSRTPTLLLRHRS